MNQTIQFPENFDDFLKTLATALLNWQGVENNMFLIFNFLVGPHPNPAVLSSIYHSVVNINTRLEIVDAAATVVLKDKQYLEKWEKLSKKIRERARKRNYLAHFGLVLHTNTEGKTEALLKPSIFNVKAKKEWEKKYDIKQIREWDRLFNSLIADLSKFLDNLPDVIRT